MFRGLVGTGISIAAFVALLHAIDFGREDVNRFKEPLSALVQGHALNPRQALQSPELNQLAQDLEAPIPASQEARRGPEKEVREDISQGRRCTGKDHEDFYRGGNWEPDAFYK